LCNSHSCVRELRKLSMFTNQSTHENTEAMTMGLDCVRYHRRATGNLASPVVINNTGGSASTLRSYTVKMAACGAEVVDRMNIEIGDARFK